MVRLNGAHGFDQSLLALVRRGVAVGAQQIAEVADQVRIGKKLSPVGRERRILCSHKKRVMGGDGGTAQN